MSDRTRFCSRRQFLAVTAATGMPFASSAAVIYTPHELSQAYDREVAPRLCVPTHEVRLYGWIADAQIAQEGRNLLEPQYILVIDSNPGVQTAFLFWRLVAESYHLVGASPISTAGSARAQGVRTPVGIFEQSDAAAGQRTCGQNQKQRCGQGALRVFDFGSWRARRYSGPADSAELRLQVQAADREAERRLGVACTDGCILLPRSLISFLDEYALLDASASTRVQRHEVPYQGRHLLVVDSGRDDRVEWNPVQSV